MRSNLGVRELGRRVGVSGSLISQIELGRVAPSVRTLYGITSALSLSLDELLSPALAGTSGDSRQSDQQFDQGFTDQRVTVNRRSLRQVLTLDSGVRWEVLSTSRNPPLEFQRTTYEAGGESAPAGVLMSHDGHEHGVVIEGILDVTVNSETYHLGSGDAISFSSSNPHRLSNSSDARAVAIWAVVGRDGA